MCCHHLHFTVAKTDAYGCLEKWKNEIFRPNPMVLTLKDTRVWVRSHACSVYVPSLNIHYWPVIVLMSLCVHVCFMRVCAAKYYLVN